MKVLITGATGFIGQELAKHLFAKGYTLHILSRNKAAESSFTVPVKAFIWDAKGPIPQEAFEGVEAVVHLLGEGIANKRWNPTQKKKILDSRIISTKALFQQISALPNKPKTVISASAIGYYGDRESEILSEESAPGIGFLSEVCKAWETTANQGVPESVRLVNFRIGVVFGKQGGMLSKLLPLFSLGLGGPVGSGNQWISWIHVKDVVGIIEHALKVESIRGPINAVAPSPVTNKEFTKALAKAVKRPAVFPVPAFAIKVALGEMSELVLSSQRVEPRVATGTGYHFQFKTALEALQSIVKE